MSKDFLKMLFLELDRIEKELESMKGRTVYDGPAAIATFETERRMLQAQVKQMNAIIDAYLKL